MIGLACERVRLHNNLLRLPREACFDQAVFPVVSKRFQDVDHDARGWLFEEEWKVIYRLVNDGNESKTYLRPLCTDISWRSKCARGMCDADPDRTRASLVLKGLSLCIFLFCFSSRPPGIGG